VLKDLPRPILRGYIHLGLARTHFAMDEREKCLNCLEIAATVFQECGYRPGTLDVLIEKARVFGFNQEEDLFSNVIQEAIDYVQVNLPEIYGAKAWSVWGEILLVRGNVSESLPMLEKSMEIYANENDSGGVARQHYLMAKALREIGDHGTAVRRVRESVTLVKSAGLKKATAEYLFYLGDLYAFKHQFPLAFVCFEKAAEMLDPSDLIARNQMDIRMKNLEQEIGSDRLNLLIDKIHTRDSHFLSCALGAVNFPRFIHARPNLV
jgi:tetratricopeptide (TPR) repeat protein